MQLTSRPSASAKIEFGEELALTAATPVPITSYEIKCDGHSFNAWDTMGANHGSFLECIFEPAAGVSTRLFSIATPSTGTLAVEFVGFTFKVRAPYAVNAASRFSMRT